MRISLGQKIISFIKYSSTVIVAALLVACGGGGGGGEITAPPVVVDPGSGWVAGEYDDWRLDSMRNICAILARPVATVILKEMLLTRTFGFDLTATIPIYGIQNCQILIRVQ